MMNNLFLSTVKRMFDRHSRTYASTSCFTPQTEGEKHLASATMRGMTAYGFSRVLPQLGERVHTMKGNVYRVVEVNSIGKKRNLPQMSLKRLLMCY